VLILLIVLGAFAIKMGPAFIDDTSIPNTPADKAAKVISKEFNVSEKQNAKVQIVFKAPKNETLQSEKVAKEITDLVTDIKKDSSVDTVVTPMQLMNLTEDKKVGYAEVTYKIQAEKLTEKSKEMMLKNIEKTRDAGIQTELTGNVGFSTSDDSHAAEAVGIVIAFFILSLTFASFLAAGMPILVAVMGLGLSLLTIVIGTHFIDIQSVSLSLASMLGLAVGIDYSLFIITRFKQQLAKGSSVQEAIAISIGTAGSAVVFAGITVIIGLLGLAVTKIPFLTMMGISAALSILTAVLVAVIVLPAVLGMIGHKIAPSNENKFLQRRTGTKEKKESTNKWGMFVTKHPFIVSLVSIALLVTITLPFFHMNLGLPDDGNTKATKTTERKAYDLLTKAYGEGIHASLVVVAKTNKVTELTPQAMNDISQELNKISGVKGATPAIPGPSGKIYMISVTPKTGPNDVETKELVKKIRKKSNETKKEHHVELMVTGTTAMNIDVTQKLNDALPIFALLIVGLAYIILVLVFRSLLLPLKAVLGFLLSMGATMGFVVFIVQDGHFLTLFGFPASSPVLAFLPIILMGILFGLAMDYEIFLVSKMREVYAHTGDPKKAILDGVRDSGKVVTAAGLIMIAVFIGFMLTPDAMIKVMGMALAFGVLFDAFIVRLTLVPAIMTLMGKFAWYLPKWLDKLLPNIDVEGESIMEEMKKSR